MNPAPSCSCSLDINSLSCALTIITTSVALSLTSFSTFLKFISSFFMPLTALSSFCVCLLHPLILSLSVSLCLLADSANVSTLWLRCLLKAHKTHTHSMHGSQKNLYCWCGMTLHRVVWRKEMVCCCSGCVVVWWWCCCSCGVVVTFFVHPSLFTIQLFAFQPSPLNIRFPILSFTRNSHIITSS